jgi:F-type H+-transporting ATPase subunit b
MALLRVDPGLVIWLWITFGIILLVLRLTVWGKITGGLDKRAERIASDLESARQAGEKAGAILAEYDQKIRDGKAEAARIIEEARVEASRLREGVLQQSQAEAREQKERAAREIVLAREDAERALRGQVVSLSFSIANSILKRETATPDNRAFVEEFADKLISSGTGNPPAATQNPSSTTQ